MKKFEHVFELYLEFIGCLEIDGYDFTKRDSGYEVLLHFDPHRRNGLLFGSLYYVNLAESASEFVGMIYTDRKFEKVFIYLPNTGRTIIVAPTDSTEQAAAMVEKYFPKSENAEAH